MEERKKDGNLRNKVYGKRWQPEKSSVLWESKKVHQGNISHHHASYLKDDWTKIRIQLFIEPTNTVPNDNSINQISANYILVI